EICMSVWKQLLFSFAVIIAALCLWVFLVPSAGQTLVKIGVPEPVVAAIRPLPAAGEGGLPGNDGGKEGGGNRGTLVVTVPVFTGIVNDRLNAIGSGEAIQSVVVMPQASGTISEILVSAGEKVVRNQVLARLDREEQTIGRERAEVALRS